MFLDSQRKRKRKHLRSGKFSRGTYAIGKVNHNSLRPKTTVLPNYNLPGRGGIHVRPP